jgi:lysophospholipase L1-like esterase
MSTHHSTSLCAMLVMALCMTCLHASDVASMPAFHLHDRILFQGDSITDGNRGRSDDPNHILGHGYVFIIAAMYGCSFPERDLTFINRGNSGNKVDDLQARWKADALDLKPTILSILIGINDYSGGVNAELYEQRYDALLDQTVKALPHVRLVLMEPFGLNVGHFKDNWAQVRPELAKRQACVDRLGVKYHAAVVHLQPVFDKACTRAPADHWIWDGIHPTYSGHQLIADEWERVVAKEWSGQSGR